MKYFADLKRAALKPANLKRPISPILFALRRDRLRFFITAVVSAIVAVLVAGLIVPTPASPLQSGSARLKSELAADVQTTILDNGLTIVTKEVPTMPAIALQAIYRVGSAQEPAEQEGLAHLFEHMMFRPTEARPVSYRQLVRGLGVTNRNGTTADEYTNYFCFITPNQLPAILTLEAERMAQLKLDPQDVELEKQAVISEREGNENRPFYTQLEDILHRTLAKTPYGRMGTGDRASMSRISPEDLRQFYQRYYRPNNAALVLVGNFETEQVIKDIRDRFSAIPSGPIPDASRHQPPAPVQRPPFTPNTREVIPQANLSLPELKLVYPAPSLTHPDRAALEVLDAVLSVGESSRMEQSLVKSGLASSAFSAYWAYREAGLFWLTAEPTADETLDSVDDAVNRLIQRVQAEGVTPAELARVKTQITVDRAFEQRYLPYQAAVLARSWAVDADIQAYDRYTEALLAVTAEDVKRVAQTYLVPEQRATFFFVPAEEAAIAADGSPDVATPPIAALHSGTAAPGTAEPGEPELVEPYLPELGDAAPAPTPPAMEQVTLANGMTVLLVPDSRTPTVSLTGSVWAGSAFDPEDKAGLADLTTRTLTGGSALQGENEFAAALEAQGIRYGISSGAETAEAYFAGLSEDLPQMLAALREVWELATFPVEPLERNRQQALQTTRAAEKNPRYVASVAANQALYPADHPRHTFQTEASLNAIARDDVVTFYRTHYQPSAMSLVLVGDFEPKQAQVLLQETFGDWKSTSSAPRPSLPAVPLPEATVRAHEVIPGMAQVMTQIESPSITRADDRYYASVVLGRIISNQLFRELREEMGLTYSTGSFFWTALTGPGEFNVYIQTAPENAALAVRQTLARLDAFRTEGVSQWQLEQAKRMLIGDHLLSISNPDQLGQALLRNHLYGLPEAEVYRYASRLDQLTQAQVTQAAQELLHPDRLVVSSAGPAIPE
ncbi:MAG: M16 family metallopeptidase [Elainellaceae cyanobacterium]